MWLLTVNGSGAEASDVEGKEEEHHEKQASAED